MKRWTVGMVSMLIIFLIIKGLNLYIPNPWDCPDLALGILMGFFSAISMMAYDEMKEEEAKK